MQENTGEIATYVGTGRPTTPGDFSKFDLTIAGAGTGGGVRRILPSPFSQANTSDPALLDPHGNPRRPDPFRKLLRDPSQRDHPRAAFRFSGQASSSRCRRTGDEEEGEADRAEGRGGMDVIAWIGNRGVRVGFWGYEILALQLLGGLESIVVFFLRSDGLDARECDRIGPVKFPFRCLAMTGGMRSHN